MAKLFQIPPVRGVTKATAKQQMLKSLLCTDAPEQALRYRGVHRIAGVDEVGRGALFGPVVAAAVIAAAALAISPLLPTLSFRLSRLTMPTIPIDSADLRREIGYVIQQIGLFPHLSIEHNITTVPRLLGWDRQRCKERAAELLDLTAGDPVLRAQQRAVSDKGDVTTCAEILYRSDVFNTVTVRTITD